MTTQPDCYQCSRYKSNTGDCTVHFIREEMLKLFVLQPIFDVTALFFDDAIAFEEAANHNHRPCWWFAQTPLGHVPGRAYRLIEQSANRADFPDMPLKGLSYLPFFTG